MRTKLLVLLMAVWLTVAACPTASDQEAVISGVVKEEGVILDDSGQRFLIFDNERGRALMEYVDEKVEVRGLLKTTPQGQVITVHSIDIIQE